MPTSIEEAADEYQTLRVLSSSELEATIQQVIPTRRGLAFKFEFNSVSIYAPIRFYNESAPAQIYAMLFELATERDPLSQDSYVGETVTIKIDDNIDKAVIESKNYQYESSVKTDISDLIFSITERRRAQESDGITIDGHDIYDTIDWDELTRRTVISNWYYTQKEYENCIRATITRVGEPTEYSIPLYFEIPNSSIELEARLEKPTSGNEDADISAEFIEDIANDIRFLEGSEVILTPEKRSSEQVARTMDIVFYVFSPEQYEKYVEPLEVQTEENTQDSLLDKFDKGMLFFTNSLGRTLEERGFAFISTMFFVFGYHLAMRPMVVGLQKELSESPDGATMGALPFLDFAVWCTFLIAFLFFMVGFKNSIEEQYRDQYLSSE